MAFYRKNIGGTHQAVRIALGLAAAAAAFVYLPGVTALLAATGGLAFALTGVFGYCPMCAVAGLGERRDA